VIGIEMLEPDLPAHVVSQARDILRRAGVEIRHREALALLADHGAHVQDGRACIPGSLIDRALSTAPAAVRLYDVLGRQTHDIGGERVHFAPGSAAIHFLDEATETLRPPTTDDYVRYVKVADGLQHLAAQSTAFVPSDVDARISDSYRLYLSLLYGRKPVVTGTFTAAGLPIMQDLLCAVRGTTEALREWPLAIFSCCPTSPLKWSEDACATLLGCARAGIPVEIVPMPLAGFTAPVTLADALAQHAAEALSGVVMHQLAASGAPLLYGGSNAIFDVRYETTPMGAVETMMLACAAAQVGRHLGLPTQGYIALSDAKRVDAQAGAETAMGATLAALAGINSVSGPGMLDFENGFSIQKLVFDDQICGSALRLRSGINRPGGEGALALIEQLLRDGHLLIAGHTRRHLRQEISFPSAIIDRVGHARWAAEGASTLRQRATAAVSELEQKGAASCQPDAVRRTLTERMSAAAREAGMDRLPVDSCAR
jgi:trimethylamine--corrinoid protein Co-methyltransferase